jgi:hypothetical protein
MDTNMNFKSDNWGDVAVYEYILTPSEKIWLLSFQNQLLVQEITLKIQTKILWQFLRTSTGCNFFSYQFSAIQGYCTVQRNILTTALLLQAFNSTQQWTAKLKKNRRNWLEIVLKLKGREDWTTFVSIVEAFTWVINVWKLVNFKNTRELVVTAHW